MAVWSATPRVTLTAHGNQDRKHSTLWAANRAATSAHVRDRIRLPADSLMGISLCGGWMRRMRRMLVRMVPWVIFSHHLPSPHPHRIPAVVSPHFRRAVKRPISPITAQARDSYRTARVGHRSCSDGTGPPRGERGWGWAVSPHPDRTFNENPLKNRK